MRQAFGLQIVEGGGSDGDLEVCRNDSNHFLATTYRRKQESSTPCKIQGQAVNEVKRSLRLLSVGLGAGEQGQLP